MSDESSRRHLFISHHHQDDSEVDNLLELLSNKGFDVRNSSVRLKPENERRIDRGEVSDETIKRLLRIKLRWASTVVVLIGEETHNRPWVNWEIDIAHQLGKRIVGIFLRGGTENDIPPSFEKYGSTLVNWNTGSILNAINGNEGEFLTPTGDVRQGPNLGASTQC